MLRILAGLVGIGFIALGIMGFLPNLHTDEKLFGLFASGFRNSVAYIALGVFALLSALKSSGTSRFFFIIVGLLLALGAFFGFYDGSEQIFKLFATNSANSWLYAILAAFFIYIGIAM